MNRSIKKKIINKHEQSNLWWDWNFIPNWFTWNCKCHQDYQDKTWSTFSMTTTTTFFLSFFLCKLFIFFISFHSELLDDSSWLSFWFFDNHCHYFFHFFLSPFSILYSLVAWIMIMGFWIDLDVWWSFRDNPLFPCWSHISKSKSI